MTLTRILAAFAALTIAADGMSAELLEPVQAFAERVDAAVDSLSQERQELLDGVCDYISTRVERGEPVRLVFICTHNSRRSHLAQVWCQIAAAHYDVPGIETFSGGTEATACNIRTVRALRRAGLSVVATSQTDNPVYLAQYSDALPPLQLYSKVYSRNGNPSSGFAAMMCCSDADEKCPLVSGSDGRFGLHYEDPKSADNSPAETQRYDERNLQIAQEMFHVMAEVADCIGKKE